MSIFLNMHQGICAFSKLTLARHNKHTELQNKLPYTPSSSLFEVYSLTFHDAIL